MAVGRCGHAVVVKRKRKFAGAEVGQVKERRIGVKGPHPALDDCRGEREGEFGKCWGGYAPDLSGGVV